MKYINLPSNIKNFRKVIDQSLNLLEGVNPSLFFSPFSVIPIISQALGLNTPLPGSGDSPYSIISLSFQLQNKNKLFNNMYAISLLEKRRIINEIYEMISPYLLNEIDDYIDLLLDTKYKPLIKLKKLKKNYIKKILEEKFSILDRFITNFDNKKGDFGYIVHYGHPEDLYKEFDFLINSPDDIAKHWLERSFPIVNEIYMSNFPTFQSKTKDKINGWVLFITNYTRELLIDSKLRKRKILQAARLAERLGTKLIGMGGLIASFAQGGNILSQEIKNIGFTTGHAFTIGNIIEIMEICLNKINIDIKKSIIGIVGAGGSIGSGCAKLLAEKSPKQIILIDLNIFNAMKRLEALMEIIIRMNPITKVKISTNLKDMKQADIIISATNSPTSIISSEFLKPGAIIIDDSFPKNVSKDILEERDDIILLEGGIIKFPQSIDIYFSRNMPDLMDIPLTRLKSCKESYGCVAETLTLALYNQQENYGLGQADPDLSKDIMLKAKKVGFSPAALQCFDEAVEEERINSVKKLKNG